MNLLLLFYEVRVFFPVKFITLCEAAVDMLYLTVHL